SLYRGRRPHYRQIILHRATRGRRAPVALARATGPFRRSPRHDLSDQGELFLAEGDVAEVVRDLLWIGLGFIGLPEECDTVLEPALGGQDGIPFGLLLLRGGAGDPHRAAAHV